MGSIKGGTPAQTVQQTVNQPNPAEMQEYQQLLNQAHDVASNNPFQQYPGQFVAPTNDLQNFATQGIANNWTTTQPYLQGAQQNFGNASNLVNAGAGYIPQAGGLVNQGAGLVGGANSLIGAGAGVAGGALPAYAQAADYAHQGTTPLAQQISGLMSPYTQSVVNATQNQFNNQNAQQANSLLGSAIKAGNAFGGDRAGIAQAQLANQQQSAQAPVIAGLYNQGFQTALQGSETQNAEALQAAGVSNQTGQGIGGIGATLGGLGSAQGSLGTQLGALGNTYGNLGLGLGSLGGQSAGIGTQMGSLGLGVGQNSLGINQALYGAGTQQQATQQAQDTALYNQFLQQQGFPYQQTSWLGNLTEGLGSGLGANVTSQQGSQTQAFNPLSTAAGLGAAALIGGFKEGGTVGTYAENDESLRAQQKQLVDGHRGVQMFPRGTRELDLPDGMSRLETQHGVFHYNADKVSAHQIHQASGGRENHILGLGPHSKAEAMHHIIHGEPAYAVVERDPHGNEVRGSVVHHSGLNDQYAAMHHSKSPENSLHIEHPGHTIAHRAGGGIIPGALSPYSGQPILLPTGGGMGMPNPGPLTFLKSDNGSMDPMKMAQRALMKGPKKKAPSDTADGQSIATDDSSGGAEDDTGGDLSSETEDYAGDFDYARGGVAYESGGQIGDPEYLALANALGNEETQNDIIENALTPLHSGGVAGYDEGGDVGDDVDIQPSGYGQDNIPSITDEDSFGPAAKKKVAGLPSKYVDEMKNFEGYTEKPHWDYKQYTSGYGTRASGPNEKIDKQTAESRFQDELYKATQVVDRVNPKLDAGSRAALTDLTFNAGSSWVNGELGKRIAAGDIEGAKPILASYNRAGGQPLQALVDRRNKTVNWMGKEDDGSESPMQFAAIGDRKSVAQRPPGMPNPTPDREAIRAGLTTPRFGGWNPLNLSDDARYGLMMGALGMASGNSANALQNLGQGALYGATAYEGARRLSNEAAKTKVQLDREENREKLMDERNRIAREHLDQTRDLANERNKQQQRQFEEGRLPPGYRKTDSGLEAIPGGPADPTIAQKKLDLEHTPPGYRKNEAGALEPIPGGPADPETIKAIAESKRDTSGDFDEDTVKSMIEQYRAGDKSVFQNVGRGVQGARNIKKMRTELTRQLKEEGKTGADQAAANANFTAQSSAARVAANREANVQSSIEEARNTFPLGLAASEKLPRGSWVPWNRAVQMVQAGTSSPELAEFVTANQGIITAYSQAMSRIGVNTVHSQSSAEKLLSTATSHEAYARVIAQMEKEMQAAVTAPETVRKMILARISGKAPEAEPLKSEPKKATSDIPPRPANLSEEAQFNKTRNQWRDDGKIYDTVGKPVVE